MTEEARFFRASAEDLGALEGLFPRDYHDRVRQVLDRTIDVYAVEYAGLPVGRLVANYENQHLDSETAPNVRACLSHFILLKEYRNRGLGSGLMRFALDDLRERGYREFTVGVEDGNAAAKHIYFAFGFTEKIDHGSDPCEYDLYLKR